MKYCTCKKIDTMVKALVQKGWLFCRGGKHGKLRHPDGKFMLTVPSSPSDHRAFLNFRRDIHRMCSF